MFIASEIFFTSLEGFIMIYSFALLSGLKENILHKKYKYLSFIIIYTIYTYWITLFIPTGFHTVPIILLTIAALNYIYNGRIYKSIIKTFLILTFVTITEAIVFIFALIITNTPMNKLLTDNLYLFIGSAISKIIECLGMFIFYKKSINLVWLNDSNPYQSKYKQILVIISAVLVFFIFGNISLNEKPEEAYAFSLFSLIIYLVLIIAIVYAFLEGSKLELLQYANKIQKENIQQLIDFNEMVAKERHEYKNHLNTIYGLCTLNKPDSLERIKKYINTYANISSTKNISINSGNDFVDAIINVKYNNALRKGTDLRVNFGEPLFSANLEEDVAVTIISNIIDNAFEAISSVEKENKYVQLHTYIRGNWYYISISNNGPMISESDKNKLFNAGYSTKDNPSKTRGFGLSIVQNEIFRCNGNIEINSTEELTEFLVSFNVKPEQAAV